MSKNPDIDWLQRKWALPDEAAGCIERLLCEESGGGTACVLSGNLPSWGNAATEPGRDIVAPLVVVRHGGKAFLQSQRLFDAEGAIARSLLVRCGRVNDRNATAAALDKLFSGVPGDDLQRKAAEVALSRLLAIITGGPGTGKTYTLARILAALVAEGIPSTRIRLAAPTGKAADRMKKAILESAAGLPGTSENERKAMVSVAGSCTTIHSLIGYNPGMGRAKFGPQNPLSCQVLILDECSMIDALQWRVLLAAIPPDCRLILLGDPNQLESVGQGNVFAEVTREASSKNSPLHPCHVHLTEARRFKERPAILEMARALEQSDANAAEDILKASIGEDCEHGIAWIERDGGVPAFEQFPGAVIDALERVAFASTPEAALDALDQVCVLTAQRQYYVGATAMSAMIEKRFSGQAAVRNHPIIIDRNDPETGLRNGNVGVIHLDADGNRKARFRGFGNKLEEFSLARLPDFSPAWAITIHRSQGSEYDNVMVVLPHEDSPLATRELLYTAITRARKNVFVVGSLSSVRKAAETPSTRTTLLPFHLAKG